MATSNFNKCLACAAVGLLWHLPVIAAAKLAGTNSPIVVDADSTELDVRNNQLLMTKVRITQPGFLITADRAQAMGRDTENNRWTLTGKVEITTPEGNSSADSAVVSFMNNEIREADLVGKPATFAVHDERRQQLAHGRAGAIHYDLAANIIRLSSDAWITYGQNEFSGETVVYDLAQKRVLAQSSEQEGKRVRITINPAEAKGGGQKNAPEGGAPSP